MAFWSTQPIGLGQKEEQIEHPQDDSFTPTELPSELRWEHVADSEAIYQLLKNHYVDDGNHRLIYSKEHFDDIFESKSFFKSLSIGIMKEDELVGYVLGRRHTFYSMSEEVKGASINFLCIKKEYRSKGLGMALIQEVKRKCYQIGIYQAMFCGEQDFGFSFTKAGYFHHPISIKKLIELDFLPSDFKPLPVYSKRDNTRLVEDEDFRRIHKIYTKKHSIYYVREMFTYDDFVDNFKTKKNVRFTIYNPKEKEFATIHLSKTYCISKKTYFNKALLYYWVGSPSIVEDAIAFCRDYNVDVFDVINVGRNNQVVANLHFAVGTGNLKYYFFNRRMGYLPSYEINVVIP